MSTYEAAFHKIKIRVAAVVFDGDDIALIRRVDDHGVALYTVPGGNVEAAEPLPHALRRELLEELGLDLERVERPPSFTWLLDAMLTRPGSTPPRKLHCVYRVHIGAGVRRGLRRFEEDDAVGNGEVVWLPYRATAGLNLFPPVPVAELSSPTAPVDAAAGMLAGVDDGNHRWI
ncbi:NUDIX domain-containing protein [Streptomyces actinomycinicus]|uniref:NUDIX domain-containing protein n=1 Tax=Streptomyces actinomycinicus TaxID=1695166 RepID=A0A937JU27_9ACTN|nr:NUDIX domain-containing protein [Streptomyces actinomycinicus]MBL1087418.1 NUDIX domain-containing protein [Streptomyces actinomycinicus]